MSLPKLIANTFRTPFTVATLIRNVKRQHAFINEKILPELATAEKTNDGSLDASDFRKITDYYGLAVPAILGESLAVLGGKKLSEKERYALTYLGAITGLFDDFFDKQYLDDQKIRILLEHPDQLEGENSSEKLFLHFYRKALKYVHDPRLVLHYFRRVYDAQIKSKKQSVPGLTENEILDITIEKGAVSVLFYRASLDHEFQEGEETALYKMGGLMQFGNDVFDVYKDRNQEIHTLLTTSKKIDHVRQLFEKTMKDSFNAIEGLSYPDKNKKKFLRLISLCLCSRCFVCFKQLESKEKLTAGQFDVDAYSRQDLVCDMEKNRNKFRTLIHFIKQPV